MPIPSERGTHKDAGGDRGVLGMELRGMAKVGRKRGRNGRTHLGSHVVSDGKGLPASCLQREWRERASTVVAFVEAVNHRPVITSPTLSQHEAKSQDEAAANDRD